MGIEVVTVRPPRCLLINVTSGESIQCLFNPTQFTERVQVNWNRISVPGLSHQGPFLAAAARSRASLREESYFVAASRGDRSSTIRHGKFDPSATNPNRS